MSRSRNIKPGFFRNEDLVELPFETRLLFIGLWTIADREGRIEDRPKRIKMELFPADDVDVDACLAQLHDAGFVLRYAVGEGRYIEVSAFGKHQNPHHKEQASTIPAPDSDAAQGANTSGIDAMQEDNPPDMPETSPVHAVLDSLNTDSLNTDSGGRGDKSPESPPPDKPKPKRATQIPNDFEITDTLRDFARDRDFSEPEINHEAEKFLNYWRSEQKPKKDWDGTWRQWILRAMDDKGKPSATSRSSPNGTNRNDLDDWRRKHGLLPDDSDAIDVKGHAR